MINKLYQVDALSAKEAHISSKKQEFTDQGRKPHIDVSGISNTLSGKSYVEKVRTILLGSSANTSKVIPKDFI